MDWLIALVKKVMDNKFSGYLQINFVRGTIANINAHATLKAEDESIVVIISK